MKTIKIFGGCALAAIAASSLGQSDHKNLFELRKEPPVEVQRYFSLGQKASTDTLHLAVSLPFADPGGAQAYADAVSNPSSPLYRHFLTPEEVGQRFGLPAYRVQKIQAYLASQGMTTRLTGKNRLSLLVDATVDQAQKAFHTSIQNFAVPPTATSAAEMRFSFTTPPAVPAEIAGDVQNIEGLENFTRPKGNVIVQALTAAQLRGVYAAANIYAGKGKQGAGRTIGISNFDGFLLSNVPLEYGLMQLPTPAGGIGANITVKPVSGGAGKYGGGVGEADLDIQAVLGMAPLCNLIIYDNYQTNPNANNNPIAVLTLEADDNTADIITESYGWAFDNATAISAHNLHVSMSAQGITYVVASGDTGTTWISQNQNYDYPATDPEVLLVGGTSLILNSDGSRASEIGWNSNGGAGGGGWNVTTDSFNKRPTYQSTKAFLAGAGVPSVASVPYRLVPDVAFDADPSTGYLIYYRGGEGQIGGTSGASPTCAGLLAELEDQLIADGAISANSKGKYRLGRMQDLLYSYNGSSQVFYDITVGNNGVLPNGSQSSAAIGWDTDSGWGPIIFSGLLSQMEQAVPTFVLSPSSVTAGSTSTGTITLSAPAPTGGLVVSLKSSSVDAVVKSSVTVTAGSTTATFPITTKSVASVTSATLTATVGSTALTATLTLNPILVNSVELSTNSTVGGSNVAITGTVTLSTPATGTGTVVTLKSSSTSDATVPATVTVKPGQTTATFAITDKAVTTSGSTTITATLNGSKQMVTLSVAPFSVTALSLTPSTLVGGASSTGLVTLNATPSTKTGSIVVLLKSSLATAKVPASVSVAAGKSTGTFTVKTSKVKSSTTSTITATKGSSSMEQVLTVHL